MEYCSVVRSPFFQLHSDYLEGVEHKFLRVCAFRNNDRIVNYDYSTIEKHLNLSPLKEGICLAYYFCFKIINDNINSPILLS